MAPGEEAQTPLQAWLPTRPPTVAVVVVLLAPLLLLVVVLAAVRVRVQVPVRRHLVLRVAMRLVFQPRQEQTPAWRCCRMTTSLRPCWIRRRIQNSTTPPSRYPGSPCVVGGRWCLIAVMIASQTPLSDTNLLHQLDKVTQDVVSALSKAVRGAMVGDVMRVPGGTRSVRCLAGVGCCCRRAQRR